MSRGELAFSAAGAPAQVLFRTQAPSRWRGSFSSTRAGSSDRLFSALQGCRVAVPVQQIQSQWCLRPMPWPRWASSIPTSVQRMDEFRQRTWAPMSATVPATSSPPPTRPGCSGSRHLPTAFGVEIQALRIRVTVLRGAAQYQVSAVVAPAGRGATRETRHRDLHADGQGIKGRRQPPSPLPTPTPTPARSGRDAGASKKLNYPFTLLEIAENVVMSSTHAPNTDL
jgi:hypothetical protein